MKSQFMSYYKTITHADADDLILDFLQYTWEQYENHRSDLFIGITPDLPYNINSYLDEHNPFSSEKDMAEWTRIINEYENSGGLGCYVSPEHFYLGMKDALIEVTDTTVEFQKDILEEVFCIEEDNLSSLDQAVAKFNKIARKQFILI